MASIFPATGCKGTLTLSDRTLSEVYSRYPAEVPDNFEKGIKASTTATHPYPVSYQIFAGLTMNATPPSNVYIDYQITMRYLGYFTDRANTFDSVAVKTTIRDDPS